MSNKQRKRFLRKITLNNEIYYWLVSDFNCDGDYGSKFQIWKDKKLIYGTLIQGETITPKVVRDIILEVLSYSVEN